MKTMELRNERVEDGKTLGCVWGEVSPSLQPPTAFSATPSAGDTPATPPILSHGFVRS